MSHMDYLTEEIYKVTKEDKRQIREDLNNLCFEEIRNYMSAIGANTYYANMFSALEDCFHGLSSNNLGMNTEDYSSLNDLISDFWYLQNMPKTIIYRV